MPSPTMQIQAPDANQPLCDEQEIYSRLLPLKGAIVVELGCGTAFRTRAIAEQAGVAHIHAFEVDAIQHTRNLESVKPANVTFHAGGAEAIDLADGSADIVMMFKSLHHVPLEVMDQALAEIARILRPDGLAYISEPIFAGDFNEILRMFHDERVVRVAAFGAVTRAVDSGLLKLVGQTFFHNPARFTDFAEFEERILNVTHTNHSLSPELYSAVKEQFERHLGPNGAVFNNPMRGDLLRKV